MIQMEILRVEDCIDMLDNIVMAIEESESMPKNWILADIIIVRSHLQRALDESHEYIDELAEHYNERLR